MKLLLPLLLFSLGPTGVVIGLLVGILLDEVLYALLVVKAAQALAVGRPWRFAPGLLLVPSIEMALLVGIDIHHSKTILARFQLVHEWFENGTYRLKNRRFLVQIPRIWTGLYQIASNISLEFATGRLVQLTGSERRHDLFGLLVQVCAMDPDGLDLGDLALLHRVALGLDLPVLAFHQSIESNYCLKREACAILGLQQTARRVDLLQAGQNLAPPDSSSPTAILRREAFAMLEDQLDAMERSSERYRQATLREQT